MAEKFFLRLLENATVLAANLTILANETLANSTDESGPGEESGEESNQMIVLFFGFITLIFCK